MADGFQYHSRLTEFTGESVYLQQNRATSIIEQGR